MLIAIPKKARKTYSESAQLSYASWFVSVAIRMVLLFPSLQDCQGLRMDLGRLGKQEAEIQR
jgi:hypothetical protein